MSLASTKGKNSKPKTRGCAQSYEDFDDGEDTNVIPPLTATEIQQMIDRSMVSDRNTPLSGITTSDRSYDKMIPESPETDISSCLWFILTILPARGKSGSQAGRICMTKAT